MGSWCIHSVSPHLFVVKLENPWLTFYRETLRYNALAKTGHITVKYYSVSGNLERRDVMLA